ncbi:unnamed protein product [Rotaria sp. Silwood1]|nr:unnamed protein product [Rotaria sp. Silwood1]CAF1462025.1 unnamed protein product [Rotaria sp. Silwood1]
MNEKETRSNDDGHIENGLNYYLKQKWKLFVTLFSLFSFMTMGMELEISGSTMLPLSIQVRTNLAKLSWIIAAKNFGYMIIVVFFGLLFQSITKNYSEFILPIAYLLPSIATALTPYFKSLWALCIALLFQGISHGLIDLALNTLITNMWSSRSTAPLNCIYFGYPVGALLSIIVVRSFRQNDPLIDKNYIKYSNSTIIIKENYFQSELVGAYIMTSIFCLISSIGFALMAYKQNQYKKKEKLKELVTLQSNVKEEINIQSKSKRLFNQSKFWKICSPTTCGQGYFAYGFILIFLILLFNFFVGGIEQGFTKFFISFVEQEQVNPNKKDSIYSMIFYWLPMLIGRIFSTFLTVSLISPHTMLTISLFLCLLTYLLWILFIWYIGLNRISLFLLVTANGLSISPISATLIGWIKQFLRLTPIELSLILSSNATGGIIFGLIFGFIFQHYGAKHLFTLLIVLIFIMFILFLFALFLQRFHSKRENKYQTNEAINQEDNTFETFLRHNQYD